MGDVIKFGGDSMPATQSDLSSLSTQVAAAVQVPGGDDLLRLLRDGDWVYGAANTEIEEGAQWAINPYSFEKGFIAWHDSKVEGEVMVPAASPLPVRSELPQVTEGWDDQVLFHLQCLNGEDKGIEVVYKTTSVGGKRAAGALATAIGSRAQAGEKALVPIVSLAVDSYTHKKYGKIYTPIFKVLKWVELGGAAPEAEPEPEEKAAPRKRTRTRK